MSKENKKQLDKIEDLPKLKKVPTKHITDARATIIRIEKMIKNEFKTNIN